MRDIVSHSAHGHHNHDDVRGHAPAAIRLRSIGKAYDEGGKRRRVLHRLDLCIRTGERVALLGRSGSGKSTLLNLIAAIDSPDEGEITVAGAALDSLGEHARTLFRRAHIGFVYQSFNLIPTLTVAENVRLPLDLNRRTAAAQRARIGTLLAEVGLADRADSFPDVLSGGEQQRVALARALIHDPAVVLADEPTGNLDVDTGRRIMALLERLTRGRTLVMVTHNPETASLADRILLLEDGSVREGP